MQTQLEEKQLLENVPSPFKGFLFLMIVVGVFFAYKHFEDAFTEVEGEPIMKEGYKEKIRGKIRKYEDCEVYELRAIRPGFYDCTLCESKIFYLNQGEIYKIGETCDKRARYKDSFYDKMKLEYVVVFKGNTQECKIEEVRRLGEYPTTAENLSRPQKNSNSVQTSRYRLLLPPGNSGLK